MIPFLLDSPGLTGQTCSSEAENEMSSGRLQALTNDESSSAEE